MRERVWRAPQFLHMRLDAALARETLTRLALAVPGLRGFGRVKRPARRPTGVFELAPHFGGRPPAVAARPPHGRSRAGNEGAGDPERRGDYVTVTKRGRKELEAAATGHVQTVRRLFVDRLTPAQLDAIGAAAGRVLAGFDQPTALPASTGAQR